MTFFGRHLPLLFLLTIPVGPSGCGDDGDSKDHNYTGDNGEGAPECDRNSSLVGTWYTADSMGYKTWYTLYADGHAIEEMFHPDDGSDENQIQTGYWCGTDEELSISLDLQEGTYTGVYEGAGTYRVSGDRLFWSNSTRFAFRTAGDEGAEEGTWEYYRRDEEEWSGDGEHGWEETAGTLEISAGEFSLSESSTEWWEGEQEETSTTVREGTATGGDGSIDLLVTHEDGEPLGQGEEYTIQACDADNMDIVLVNLWSADCGDIDMSEIYFVKQ